MSIPPETPTEPAAAKTRPGAVTVAVWLQILLAVFVIAQAVTGLLYGADAQAAAEAELDAQGYSLSDLPEGTTFEFGGIALIGPVVAALLLIVLALLNGAGKRPARVITWIVQPLVLLCGGFLAFSQLLAADLLQAGIEATGGPEDLDAAALFDAVFGAYPAWAGIVDYGLFALATVGSLLVIVLLAVPASNAFFRKETPQTFIPGAPAA
ncbi:hypothetical protein [Glycomyces sp. NRRL B-16210]|uniref:hypothetical protein n=1 Tax=Glycomyces sp. NRRL B-16210 TaxID=1463821 RepID=UPI0004BF6E13|nr:hypothetical protein [Glycomyces sp. NRRL B-16210]